MSAIKTGVGDIVIKVAGKKWLSSRFYQLFTYATLTKVWEYLSVVRTPSASGSQSSPGKALG